MSTSEPYHYDYAADFYDWQKEYRTRTDVAFFVDEAKDCGGPVLEVGCGTGRILIPTARAGVDIVGLDLSERMLAQCEQKLSTETEEVGARVRLVRGDMTNFAIDTMFQLVTLPFRPFQHLVEVKDQLACLDCIRQHMQESGRLILDLFNPSLQILTDESHSQEQESGQPFEMPDGRQVQRRHRIAHRDFFGQVQQVELIYYVTHPDGRQERLAGEAMPRTHPMTGSLGYAVNRTYLGTIDASLTRTCGRFDAS